MDPGPKTPRLPEKTQGAEQAGQSATPPPWAAASCTGAQARHTGRISPSLSVGCGDRLMSTGRSMAP